MKIPALPVAVLLSLAPAAFGQADFHEPFEHSGPNFGAPGPPDLIAKGWTFRNQSEPVVGNAWFNGPVLESFVWTFDPQAGDHYLAANGKATDTFNGGPISTWAILPQVPGQTAGDAITLWARENPAPQNDTRIEVRYSPTGGIGTGTSATDVGDFTTLLAAIDPIPTQAWSAFEAEVPGPGRLALRFHVPAECGWSVSSCSAVSFVAVDELHVGPATAPPCNAPPTPVVGQTTVWPASGSPYELCTEIVIPAGATVAVEPGVHIELGDHSLIVEGRLEGFAAGAAPISLHSDKLAPYAMTIAGEVELEGAVLDLPIAMSEVGSRLVLRHSTLDTRDAGQLSQDDDGPTAYDHVLPVVLLQDVLVLDDGVGTAMYLPQAQTFLQDVTCDRGLIWCGGYVYADGVTVHDSPTDGLRLASPDGVYVDGLTVLDAAGAGVVLTGYACGLGPDVTILGCDYPIAAAGLHFDANVPQAGNDVNAVYALGGGYWPNLGLPWHATVSMGGMVIEPGTTVLSGPGTKLSPGRAQGTPTQPITFGALDPTSTWGGLYVSARVLANLVVEDADFGIQTVQSNLWVWNTIVRGCEIGMIATSGGVLVARSTTVEGNQIGVKTTNAGGANFSSPDSPNVVAGNVVGMVAEDPSSDVMEWIWWGDASGPQQPDNPGGAGDSVEGSGADDVDVLPFLTAPPAAPDLPPVIRLVGHQGKAQINGLTLDPGDHVFIEWESFDDHQVAEHRIYYSPISQHPSTWSLIDVLPGDQTTYDYVAPDVGLFNSSPYFIVEAVDDAGQRTMDSVGLVILDNADEPTEGVVSPDHAGESFAPGVRIDAPGWAYTTPGIIEGDPELWVIMDATETWIPLGSTELWCDLPITSTDRARFGIVKKSTTNRQKWMFGDYFSVRPDALIADAPPTVTLTSPASGQAWVGGSDVTITWLASDDEGLRAFNLQASTDGGKRWRTFARDLPPTQTSYTWTLPPTQGLDDVRLRVVAFDLRNQNSSSDLVPGIDVLPGQGPVCQADLGFGGPGSLAATLCGSPLDGVGTAELELVGAAPGAPLAVGVSFLFQPAPLLGGTIVLGPDALLLPFQADATGELHLPLVLGGVPATLYLQAVAADATLPGGFAISNALQVELVP
ncbi:choice-of-anchor J domain-containing protein [Engelhardtia mirabilis]|uniref:Ser-Thr-rich glycosyl-phosphatidyl-inositol-anchored membrane family protein n=1 Tax=Engelhardtia mirabilis TaxID=2528011 RepID=A0A518BS12_9BACT|nr:Ser-Thr-rich glycosyl-phosphatidyl-inositol-anchored membrane family protein [Planctomycetes bacterium Pla133]QDV04090.1 Ser-Thr-rich glycosyl-phosphatidyl-inositol-anchored membrane family protein [Planctomycetes bacterium Pla86]